MTIERLDLTEASRAFAALGSAPRLAILQAMVVAGPEGLPMGALGEKTGIHGSTLTHHVRALVMAGLARQDRQGRSIVAITNFEAVERLSAYLLANCCAESGKMRTRTHG